MEHWEFLLQKEGDRSWLPLDSPDVEILEGRYRVVARSNHINTTIEVRIAHLATEAVPPKRRVQKRSCRTNHEGLMVVIPFTHLEPGQWELSCSPADLMTDLMAGAQPYALKLQVVAQSLEEEWDPDWASPADSVTATASIPGPQSIEKASNRAAQGAVVGNQAASVDTPARLSPMADPLSLSAAAADREPASLPPEVAEILGASMDRLFQIAEQMSEQLVDEVLQDLDLTAIADAPASAATVKADSPAPEAVTIAPASLSNLEEAGSREQQPPLGYTLAVNETFLLALDQTTLVAARGDVITLSGLVTIAAASEQASGPTDTVLTPPTEAGAGAVDPWESDVSLHLPGATAQEIQFCLRDPQSLQVLVSDRQPLPSHTLPYPFSFSFSLPETFTTHLVLGEVLLCGTLADTAEAPIALVTQAFSITVDPNTLVGELTKLHQALTTEIEDEERIDLPLELSSRLKEQTAPSLDLSFLNLGVVEPPTERSPRFPSLAGQPLPPQIYRPDPNQVRPKVLDLPAFKLASQPQAMAPADSSPTARQPSIEQALSEQALSEQTRSEQTLSEQALSEQALSDTIAASAPAAELKPDLAEAMPTAPDAIQVAEASPSDNLASTPDDEVSSDPIVAPDHTSPINTENVSLDLPSPTQMSFQSLKLQDRFLTRLTSLATDAELTAQLKANLAPGSPSPSSATAPSVAPSAADVRSLTEEIVVDDEPLPIERRRYKPIAADESAPVDAPPHPLILPADDPVPTPILEVTTGELTAGKPVNIRVKLPNLLPRIYVKLWVTDRQTRSLLDGPRWLVDFLPNGFGDLEAMTPLTVPFGSVELRFEAIAVEMHTQRESHKVTVDRGVIPADLPSVSLDDFHA